MGRIELINAQKRFGQTAVIKSVSLTVDEGDFVVLVGPSGCGKSTLLRMIAGLEDVTAGDVVLDGASIVDVDPAERGIAMVFQSYALYPHMTVRENMGFALMIARRPKADVEAKVKEAAEILQLDHLLDRFPRQLSGGQRQRVAIGRAIVRAPKVFLFDEPLSNLDAELRVEMRLELAQLHRRLGTTMVYVTHDQTEAMTLADKIVVLRQGEVEQIGSPLNLYNDPDNVFVATFIGSPKMNMIRVSARPHEDGVAVMVPGSAEEMVVRVDPGHLRGSEEIALGIRPEAIEIGAVDGGIPFSIGVAENLGGTTYLYGALPDGSRITIESRGDRKLSAGDTIGVSLPAQKSYLFDSDGKRMR